MMPHSFQTQGTTTDLAEVRRLPKLFTWGQVTQIHDIGRYSIVEYKAKDYNHRGAYEQKSSFHVYVDGASTSNSCDSLEAALLLAIARGKTEPNQAGWMARAAAKLLEVEG